MWGRDSDETELTHEASPCTYESTPKWVVMSTASRARALRWPGGAQGQHGDGSQSGAAAGGGWQEANCGRRTQAHLVVGSHGCPGHLQSFSGDYDSTWCQGVKAIGRLRRKHCREPGASKRLPMAWLLPRPSALLP